MSRRPRIPIPLIVIVVLLLGSELVVRAAASHLRDPLEWGDWEAQNKVEQMDALQKAHIETSIVVVGSSMMNAAVVPEQLRRMLGARQPVYNAALNGGDLRTLEPWTLEVVLPRLRPKVVVIGFSSLELNDNGITQADFYRKFTHSPAGARASNGPFVDRLEGWTDRISTLVRYRTVLRRPASALSGPDPEQETSAVGPYGVLAAIGEFHARPYGINPVFRARTEQQSLHDYAAGGRQLQALGRLVEGLRARGVQVVIVQTPVTSDAVAMHPHGSADFKRFQRVLAAFVGGEETNYIDMRSRFGDNLDFFVDPLHLNGSGATRFTSALATFFRSRRLP